MRRTLSLLMVLLGTIGLGLDSSYWYWQGWKEQQAGQLRPRRREA